MWPVLPDFRWDPGRSHSTFSRVEVWSQNQLVESDAPFIGGAVTERWVTGPRSTLSLSVEPSPEWIAWFGLPLVELRVYGGMSWGISTFECPLGIFPVTEPSRSLPAQDLSVMADDRWQRVTQDAVPTLSMGSSGLSTALAAQLMSDAGLGEISVVVGRPVWSPALVWDKSRDELIKNYLEPTGSEAFIDRTGVAIIRDRTPSLGRDLIDGVGGTIVNISSTKDWSKVVNSVTAVSSKTDAVLDPVKAKITDWGHPAHESKIGRRTIRVSSPLISTADDARTFAFSQLEKLSAPALSWSVTCVPDPTRMPGDLLTVTTALGSIRSTVQEVTHPLGPGEQTVKLGATTL